MDIIISWFEIFIYFHKFTRKLSRISVWLIYIGFEDDLKNEEKNIKYALSK